jgi:hypothetical protein
MTEYCNEFVTCPGVQIEQMVGEVITSKKSKRADFRCAVPETPGWVCERGCSHCRAPELDMDVARSRLVAMGYTDKFGKVDTVHYDFSRREKVFEKDGRRAEITLAHSFSANEFYVEVKFAG